MKVKKNAKKKFSVHCRTCVLQRKEQMMYSMAMHLHTVQPTSEVKQLKLYSHQLGHLSLQICEHPCRNMQMHMLIVSAPYGVFELFFNRDQYVYSVLRKELRLLHIRHSDEGTSINVVLR